MMNFIDIISFQMSVLRALERNGMQPYVHKTKGSRMSMIDLPSCGVRLVDICSFLAEKSILKMAMKYSGNHFRCSFPRKMRRRHYVNSNLTECPSILYFNHITDTEETISHNQMFCDSHTGSWGYFKELRMYSDNVSGIIMDAMQNFINFAFDIQEDILALENPVVEPCEDEMLFTHPFCRPLITLTGFLFRIWKLLLMPKTLYGVNNEHTGVSVARSSKKEMLFGKVIVGTHKHPNCISGTFESPSGQRLLKGCQPDLYCNKCKHAWFFHGCWIHAYVFKQIINFTQTAALHCLVQSWPALVCLGQSWSVLSWPVLSSLVQSWPVLASLGQSWSVLAILGQSCLGQSWPVFSSLGQSCPILSSLKLLCR
jgi:hypothetical protein